MRCALRWLTSVTGVVVVAIGVVRPAAGLATTAPVDPYQGYVRAACLSFVEQPGVVEYRDMILGRIGGGRGGIHACSGFEHGDGRAWDWIMDAANPAQAARVARVLTWLLATDAAGNPHAMARRLGIGNIIWNRQSISLWTYATKVWEPYAPCTPTSSPSVCHTNHVHFAFSWAGALRQTTWFTTLNRPGAWYPDGVGPPIGPPPNAGHLGDLNRDGRPDLAVIDATGAQLSIRANASAPGRPAQVAPVNVGPPGWSSISDYLVADYDGDGCDDIIARQVPADTLYLWRCAGADGGFAFASPYSFGRSWNALARLLPPADFDGDGRPELAGFDASGAQLYVHRNLSAPGHPAKAAGAAVGPPAWASISDYQVVDFDGDGRDDIVGRQVQANTLYVWRSLSTPAAFGFAAGRALGTGWNSLRTLLPMSDFDGDGRPDVAGLDSIGAQMYLYRNVSVRGWTGLAPGVAVGPPGWASVSGFIGADFDGDGRDDIIGRQVSTGYLFLWRSTAGGGRFGFAALDSLGPGWNARPRILSAGPVP